MSKQPKSLCICIISDAWHPQVNGVVRTLSSLQSELKGMGHRVYMITPKMFKTVPCPTYPEIRLSLNVIGRLSTLLDRINADAIHIATEGPLGWAARRWCLKKGQAFTTAYHTAFPEYIAARTPFGERWFYPIFRKFHAPASGVLVATATVRKLLKKNGFKNIVNWTRGVDTKLFQPANRKCASPSDQIQLYVGRVAVEKNIEAFLSSRVPGRKIVVGDGPALKSLRTKYPDVEFRGALQGQDLAAAYRAADVFVFPSKTDTFGLVMIEALACGTPVAAYPVQGPLDVLGHDGTGPFSSWHTPIAALDQNLETAIRDALTLNRRNCARFAAHYNWATVAEQFVDALCLNDQQTSHRFEKRMLKSSVILAKRST